MAKEIKKINVGGEDYNITDENAVRVDNFILSGTTTMTIGGINKGKTYENATIQNVLTDLLFPYVAPSFNSLTLYNASNSTVSTTHEYGTSVVVAKFKPSFTLGSKAITSIKVGTSSGGSDLYSNTSASSGSTYNLTTTKSYDGKTTGSNRIYCTISDGDPNGVKSGWATVTFSYYPYAYVSSSNTVSSITSGAIKSTSTLLDSSFSLTLSSDSYVWILLPPGTSGTKTIQYEALGQWYNFDGGTSGPFDVSLKLNSGTTVTYKGYRTNKKAAAGTTSFKIV